MTFRAKTTGTATVAVFATEYLMAGPSYALGKVGKVELTKEWADYTLELDGGIQAAMWSWIWLVATAMHILTI